MRAGLADSFDSKPPTEQGGAAEPAATRPQASGFVPPQPAELAPLFDQLEIQELIGLGGMGAVYKARQAKLDRLVALKIIRPESADDQAFAERFHREARALARLNHPHIVGVYDFGEVRVPANDTDVHASQDGAPKNSWSRSSTSVLPGGRTLYYFIMEYVDGLNLRQTLQAGRLAPEQALAIVPQVCEALQFAHEEGVVHRDIKPENILLDRKGRVKIADFGLAKLAARSAEDFTLSDTRQVMGTPRYMAPEQMEGARAVDHRADIYSLGVVFYEMLTGEIPAGHFEPPSKKVQVDVRLDEVVLRSLAREPERRYQHASDIKSDIETIATPATANRPLAMHPADSAPTNVSPTVRFSWNLFWLGMLFLIPALGLITYAMMWTQSAWTLLALAIPWFVLGCYGGGLDGAPHEKVLDALAVIAFLVSLGLIGLGIWLENSAWPLIAGLPCAVAAIAGAGIAFAAKSDDSKSNSDAPAAQTEQEEAEEAVTPEKAVESPANWMTFVAFLACLWLVTDGCDVLMSLLKGNPTEWRPDLLLASPSPLVLFGAIMMGQLRYYPLAVLASVLCIPIGFGSEITLYRIVPLITGVRSLATLLRPEVRAAFRQLAEADARSSTASEQTASKPADEQSLAQPTGATIRQAWDNWWSQRDRWFTTSIQTVLILVVVACLILFLSFHMSSNHTPGSEHRQHVTIEYGVPSPWFYYES
jgi:serine/threonine protein kinase